MKVFLDSNVFIIGLRLEDTNSALILELKGKKHGIRFFTSELVLEEVDRFFNKNFSEKDAFFTYKFIRKKYEIVLRNEIEKELQIWKGKIKDKDLENLATAKREKAEYLVSFDRDYKDFSEYLTPKAFIKKLGLKEFKTEY